MSCGRFFENLPKKDRRMKLLLFLILIVTGIACLNVNRNHDWITQNRMKLKSLGLQTPANVYFFSGIYTLGNAFILLLAIMGRRTDVMRGVSVSMAIASLFTISLGCLTIYDAFYFPRNTVNLSIAVNRYDVSMTVHYPTQQIQEEKCQLFNETSNGCEQEINEFKINTTFHFMTGVLAMAFTQLASIFLVQKWIPKEQDDEEDSPAVRRAEADVIAPMSWSNTEKAIRGL